jgi:organic hydroperoxide reductase OsmC/OhrA
MSHKYKNSSVKDFTDLRLLMASSSQTTIDLKNEELALEKPNTHKGTAMSEIIDYAMPMMKIEQLMRKIHDHCLMSKFDKAEIEVNQLSIEVLLLLDTIRQMKNEQ